MLVLKKSSIELNASKAAGSAIEKADYNFGQRVEANLPKINFVARSTGVAVGQNVEILKQHVFESPAINPMAYLAAACADDETMPLREPLDIDLRSTRGGRKVLQT